MSAIIRCTLLLFSIAIAQVSFAQPSAPKREGERNMFVEIKDLDEGKYAKLSTAMSSEERMSIKSACVPARVLMITIPDSNSENLEANLDVLKEIIFAAVGQMDVKLLAEYSEESFLNRCKQFRGSGKP